MFNMIVQPFEHSSARMIRQLLWRCAALAAFLGLALTQTTPAAVETSALTGSLPAPTVAASSNQTASSSRATTTSVETYSSFSTTEMTNGTSNRPTNHTVTSAQVSSPLTTAIVGSSPTTVSMATAPPVPSPEPYTMPAKTTLAPSRPGPTKYQHLVSAATTTGSDLVTPTDRSVPPAPTNNVALYLLLPLVTIAAIAMLVMIVSYLRKRIKLDKLRHQLLPLYNFDPQEGEDWETELLTESRPSSQTPLNPSKPKPTTTAIAEIPKLRFSPDTVDV